MTQSAVRLAVVVILTLVALGVTEKRRYPYVIGFLGLFLLNSIVLLAPGVLGFHPEGLDWNWIGKSLEIAWVLLFLWVAPLSAKDLGLTFRQRPGSVITAVQVVFVYLAIYGVMILVLGGGLDPDSWMETFLFQATMPGIAEELSWRGVFLSLLILGFGGTLRKDEYEWTRPVILAVVVTGVAFGLVHGLSFDGGLQFDVANTFFTGFVGLIFAWLRVYTGSLVFPIILHNASNSMSVVMGFLL